MQKIPWQLKLVNKIEKLSNGQIIGVILGLSLLLVFIGYMVGDTPSVLKGPKPVVAATVYPVYDVVRQVSGESIEVRLGVPVGEDPYSYQLTKQDVKELSSSDVLFTVGHGLDAWADTLPQVEPELIVTSADELVSLLPSGTDSNSYDPHYWLSIPDTMLFSKSVSEKLQAAFPERAELILQNQNEFASELAKIDNQFRKEFSNLVEPQVFLFDSAWKYLLRDYGFVVMDEFNQDVSDLTASEIDLILIQVSNNPVNVAIFSTEDVNQDLINRLKRLGIQVIILEKFGGEEGQDTYISLMQNNLSKLLGAF